MKHKDFFIILWRYIKQYRFLTAIFLLFCLIYGVIFSLYNLEIEAVIYASMICLITAITIISIHFYLYYKKHHELLHILNNVEVLVESLPTPTTLSEIDYQEIITALHAINLSNQTNWSSERSDCIDYYTTWVHQIKAPIAVMQLILQGEDTDEYKELLSELFRIEQYSEMALSYLRLDNSSNDFVFKQYNLDNIIRQVIRKYASQFVRKRIRLNYNGTDGLVLTDEKWLCFIIEQILSNAIKYTETGSITISVENKVIIISDTGIGIATEDLPRIFEKGFTGYNGRSDKKATGLGLYLCKRAANRLSHKLSVISSVGVGTTLSIDMNTDEFEIE